MRTKQRRSWQLAGSIGVALLVGLLVLVLLAPASGADTLPPKCWGMLGYSVPCGSALSLAAGAVTAGIVGLALWFNSRRRKHQK